MRAAKVFLFVGCLLAVTRLVWAAHAALSSVEPAETSAASAPTAAARDDGRAALEARRTRVAAYFEQALDEGSDPASEQQLSRRVTSLLAAQRQLTGLVVDEVRCSAVLCRVLVRFGAGARRERVEPLLGALGPVLGSEVWSHGERKTGDVALYVARPGGTLPFAQARADRHL